MRKLGLGFLLAISMFAPGISARADVESQLGGGIELWLTTKNSDAEFVDEIGYSWMVNYRLKPFEWVAFELDLEMFPDYFGGYRQDVFAPQFAVIAGKLLYGGVGIGTLYSEDSMTDPFYSLRAGVNIPLGSRLCVDASASYRFMSWNPVKYEGPQGETEKDLNTDIVTLAAALRLVF
jgi:hypothetical protein